MEQKRQTRASIQQNAPWLPCSWDIADVAAIQALQRGDASADQQRRALAWIINSACATYDLSYRPGGQDGDRDTAFALGRAFVGQQIVKVMKLALTKLPGRELTEGNP